MAAFLDKNVRKCQILARIFQFTDIFQSELLENQTESDNGRTVASRTLLP